MKQFTVIAVFKDNNQLFATSVEATDPDEAMSIVALQLSHATADIIGCVEGKHQVYAPCEDSGKIASVDDMPIDSETWLETARQAVRADVDACDMIWLNLCNSLGIDDVDPEDLPAALGIDGTETVEVLRTKLMQGLRSTGRVDDAPLVPSPGISKEAWDAAFAEELKRAFPGFRNDGDVRGADLVEWIGIRFGQHLNNE